MQENNKTIRRGSRYILDSYLQEEQYHIFVQRCVNNEKQSKWQQYELSHCPVCNHNQFDGCINNKGYRNRICITQDMGMLKCYECNSSFSFAEVEQMNNGIYKLLCKLRDSFNVSSVISKEQVEAIIMMIRERQTLRASPCNHIDHIIPLYILVTAYFADKHELLQAFINNEHQKEFDLLCYSLFNSSDNLCEISAENNIKKSSLMLDMQSLKKLLTFHKYANHLAYLHFIKKEYGLDFTSVSNKRIDFKS